MGVTKGAAVDGWQLAAGVRIGRVADGSGIIDGSGSADGKCGSWQMAVEVAMAVQIGRAADCSGSVDGRW